MGMAEEAGKAERGCFYGCHRTRAWPNRAEVFSNQIKLLGCFLMHHDFVHLSICTCSHTSSIPPSLAASLPNSLLSSGTDINILRFLHTLPATVFTLPLGSEREPRSCPVHLETHPDNSLISSSHPFLNGQVLDNLSPKKYHKSISVTHLHSHGPH